MRFVTNLKKYYLGITGRTRLLSQIAVFLVFMVAFLTLGDFLYRLFVNAPADFWRNNSTDITIAVIFQLLIAIIFLGRFGLLFFRGGRALWFSQLLWLSGILSIYFYMIATRGYFLSETDHWCMDCILFRYTSESFNVIVFSYYTLSILKEILYGFISAIAAIRSNNLDV